MTEFELELAGYRARLAAAGLGGYADALEQAALPSVRLIAKADADVSEPGSSRLGGAPDVPGGTPWPRRRGDGAPLSFIAQVDLAAIASHDAEGVLPRAGLLSFFYDAVRQDAWGFNPEDRGAWAVLHSRGVPLAPRQAPPDLAADGRFPAVTLTPQQEITFAPWESAAVGLLGMSGPELWAYSEVLGDAHGTIHRLLGHADPVQSDMQLECQLASNGIYCGDATGHQHPRAAALRPGAADWRLLLQVDSQDEAGMMWGDVGRLYYWIKRDDLAARRWDHCWLVLQCC